MKKLIVIKKIELFFIIVCIFPIANLIRVLAKGNILVPLSFILYVVGCYIIFNYINAFREYNLPLFSKINFAPIVTIIPATAMYSIILYKLADYNGVLAFNDIIFMFSPFYILYNMISLIINMKFSSNEFIVLNGNLFDLRRCKIVGIESTDNKYTISFDNNGEIIIENFTDQMFKIECNKIFINHTMEAET